MAKHEIYFGLREHFVGAGAVLADNAQSMASDAASLRTGPALLRKGTSVAAAALMNAVLLAGGPRAEAQNAGPAASPSPSPGGSASSENSMVSEVVVQGDLDRYRTDAVSLPKFTEALRDTPQSVTVVPRQVIEDQGGTTLRDALRNVSGISLAAGEGGSQGDNLTIRGFTSRSDIFLDGMRDFGSYYRDPFNLDAVEVLKGPSSIAFGRGSTGGVVNQVSKQPTTTPFVAGSLLFGTDLTRRATLDVNEPLAKLGLNAVPGAALRINVMGTEGNVAGRDIAENRRYGIAPTLALGLGKPTRFTLSYLHQSEDNIPDYGVPWLLSRPAPVNRENYYGFESTNFLKTDVDIVTAKLEHDVNANLSLREQVRYANYERNIQVTEALIPATVTRATPLDAIQVTRNQIDAKSTETTFNSQTDATARFKTGPLGHALIGGFEYIRETSDPTRRVWTGVPTTSLLSPDTDQAFGGVARVSSKVKTTVETLAFYAVDTIKFGDKWQVVGGLRYDRVDADYTQSIAPAAQFSRVDEMLSWRAALVFKPLPNGSVYFSSGTSFNPSAEQLALAANNANLPPEKNLTFEIGTKWDLFNERLSVYGAIFQLEKTNARTTDPNNPLLNVLGGDQRVRGFEVGAAGHITAQWQVLVGYTYLDNEVVESTVPAQVGNRLLNTPTHSFALWTTVDLPWKIQVGGGLNYVSSRTSTLVPDASTGLIREAPGYVVFNLMAKYQFTPKISIQMNLNNVTDEYYFDGIHPAHIIPGAGRTLLFSTNFTF